MKIIKIVATGCRVLKMCTKLELVRCSPRSLLSEPTAFPKSPYLDFRVFLLRGGKSRGKRKRIEGKGGDKMEREIKAPSPDFHCWLQCTVGT